MPQPFLLESLEQIENERLELDLTLIQLLGEANRKLSRFDGMVQCLPNPMLFLTNLTKAEAVDSSRIEGTQATIDDLYAQEAGEQFRGEKDKDLEEITNYEAALRFGSESIMERDLSLSLIKEMHARLLKGVRGADKDPGSFRKIQNWIGHAGSTLATAQYVPPEPLHVVSLLDEMIHYYMTSQHDILIKTAMVHAQFESIHPFLDGNGRLGRLLIPLMLYKHGVLTYPVFYLSSYLESHRSEYYRALHNTHQHDWSSWVSFFLRAVGQQAIHNINKVNAMRELYASYVEQFNTCLKGGGARELVEAMFVNPIFTLKTLSRSMNDRVKIDTLRKSIKTLIDHRYVIIVEEGQGRKPTRYLAQEIMNVLR